MNSTCLMLGMMTLGIWELLLILGLVIGFAAAVALGVVFLTAVLARQAEASASSRSPASTVKLAACPRCGTTLPSDAPQGLCPRCVLQVGIGTADASEPAFRDASGKPNPPDPAELARHFPQLEIIELLGQGGMGAVYKARQKDLERFVALKVLPGGAGGDPAFAERFTREARALAKLNHPNIVAVHDFGQVDRGTGFQPVLGSGQGAVERNTDRRTVPLYYFIMEFIDGPSLRQLMQTRRLEPREAMSIVPRICEALQYAHEEGIVHRDIKPENILLDTKGRVKIADFGIAKIADKGRDRTLTGAKDVIGTPHYMAPEQVERPAEVDHRADIYSLGVVFYEMLTGELPLGKFEAPSRKVQMDVRLDEVVLHSLEKEPARRYQHASEVRTDVESIAGSPATSQRTSSPGPMAASLAEARRQVKGPAIGLLVTGILNWVLIPTILWRFALGVPETGIYSWMGQSPAIGALALISIAVCGFITFAAISMMRLEHRRSALVASAMTILISPGNVVGLPVGIWSLIVLSRENVRQAFQTRTGPTSPPGSQSSTQHIPTRVTVARWAARVPGTLLLAFYSFFIVAEGLPPIAEQSVGVQLNFVALGLMLGGFAIGWKREGSAALLIAGGWTLWHISEGRIDLNLFQTPLPVAALYAYCWWESRGRQTGLLVGTAAVLVVAFVIGRLALPVNVFVSGTITDTATSEPIPNADLTLVRQNEVDRPLPNARTGAEGRFRMHVGWYAAGQQVVITAPGYSPVITNLGPREPGQRRVSRHYELSALTAAQVRTPAPDTIPPVVLRTSPESGSTGVDHAMTELRVTFSRPMKDGSWAWVTLDGETFPQRTGEPRYLEDRRTCVLPVKLEPGRTYAAWINVGQFTSFQAEDGTPAIPYLLIFETRK